MPLDALNIFFGIVTVVSFCFAIYSHYRNHSRKLVEEHNRAKILERMNSAYLNAQKIYETADFIVQESKSKNISLNELRNHARIIRRDAAYLKDYVGIDNFEVKRWKIGEPIYSDAPTSISTQSDTTEKEPESKQL